MRSVLQRACAALLLSLVLAAPAQAWNAFTVQDIRVEGANRISVGTVLNYLPARTGESFGPQDAQRAIRSLYGTGLFEDVSLARDGDTLVVHVRERPAIAEINIDGDFSIEEDKLRKSLSSIGLDRGRTFNRSLLEQVQQDLRRQLYSRGKYGMEMDVKVRDLERNRVAIDITINEGKTARIRQIKIIGNKTFDDGTLKDLMESGIPGPLSVFSSADEYSRAKLEGDLEAVRSYYLDRGFAQFSISSSQVTITPDKKDIYITINVDEGERYRVGNVELAGDEFPVPREELQGLIELSEGDVFSRKTLSETRKALSDRLAESGFAFARINVVPELHEDERTVDVRFFIDPGKRAYVRRITFSGHTATEDHVFRRELRQIEGARFSPARVDRSKVRLQRLPQVQQVQVQTEKVAGTDDQVDVNYQIQERRTGSLSLSAGVSSSEGVVFSAAVQQKNLFGTGKDLTVRIDTSQQSRQFTVRHTNPYYTQWGMSRSLRFSYRETDPSNISNTQNYFTDSGSVGVEYGIPVSEYDELSLGIGVEGTRIRSTASTQQPILDFLDANGSEFGFLEGTASYSHDTRNRTIFPERGALQRGNIDVALPGSDIQFYKLGYRFEGYTSFTDRLVGSASLDVGLGESYGEDQKSLPFFRRYYAGGIRSVRGYKAGSLGPKYPDGDPAGGDLRTVGGFELIFPPPISTETGQTRLSLFYDFGTVFAGVDNFDSAERRSSAGISFNWRSPVGPLSFSFAEPINPKPGDDTQKFQFTIGTLF